MLSLSVSYRSINLARWLLRGCMWSCLPFEVILVTCLYLIIDEEPDADLGIQVL